MAIVNQAVVNPLLDAPAKSRGHLIVTRKKVANKVTHSFFIHICFLMVFIHIFLKYIQNDMAHANETKPGAFFYHKFFFMDQ